MHQLRLLCIWCRPSPQCYKCWCALPTSVWGRDAQYLLSRSLLTAFPSQPLITLCAEWAYHTLPSEQLRWDIITQSPPLMTTVICSCDTLIQSRAITSDILLCSSQYTHIMACSHLQGARQAADTVEDPFYLVIFTCPYYERMTGCHMVNLLGCEFCCAACHFPTVK